MNDEPIGPPDSQTSNREFPSEQLFQSTDESTTSPVSCFPKKQNPHRYEATPQEDQIKDECPLPETDTTEHRNPSAELPQQTQIPDPYISSTDEYSDSESSDSEFEQPLDWDDMDPAQRHAWLRDHPIPTPIPSKLLSTKTENLTKLQLKKLRQTKKPRSFDIKSLDKKDNDSSQTSNCEITLEIPTSISYPPLIGTSHKRDIDDEIQVGQPINKLPRQLSPSQNASSNLEPKQLRPPTPNIDDFNPPSTLNIGQKRQQQNDHTQDNKKQKCQEDTILLTTTEPVLSQPITIIDSIPTSSDSLMQPPLTPALPQLFPQPEINEPISNETALDNPNQERIATETHGFKTHSIPVTEPPSEPLPHEIAISTSHLMTEPLLHQSETPMTPLDTVTRGFNPHAVPTTMTEPSPEPPPSQLDAVTGIVDSQRAPEDQDQPSPIVTPKKPAHWNQMTAAAKSNWNKRNKQGGKK